MWKCGIFWSASSLRPSDKWGNPWRENDLSKVSGLVLTKWRLKHVVPTSGWSAVSTARPPPTQKNNVSTLISFPDTRSGSLLLLQAETDEKVRLGRSGQGLNYYWLSWFPAGIHRNGMTELSRRCLKRLMGSSQNHWELGSKLHSQKHHPR